MGAAAAPKSAATARPTPTSFATLTLALWIAVTRPAVFCSGSFPNTDPTGGTLARWLARSRASSTSRSESSLTSNRTSTTAIGRSTAAAGPGVLEQGPGWDDIEEAIRWGRERAPKVFVRIGGKAYSAGEEDPDDGTRVPVGVAEHLTLGGHSGTLAQARGPLPDRKRGSRNSSCRAALGRTLDEHARRAGRTPKSLRHYLCHCWTTRGYCRSGGTGSALRTH